MKIDELLAAGEKAAEAALGEMIDRATAPFEEAAEEAKAVAASATTALAVEKNERAAERQALTDEIKRLTALTQPPVRPSFGTPGKTTIVNTPTDIHGVSIVGPVKFQTSEFELYDFATDLQGTYTSQTNVIQVDGQAVFGRAIIADGVISVANPTPYLASGITGMNVVITDVEISGTVDGMNVLGDVVIVNPNVHDLAQFPAGTPGVVHADGAHCDALALAQGIKRVVLIGGRLAVGDRITAGSLSCIMVSPGLPAELRIIGTELTGGVPINYAQATLPAILEFSGARFGRGPVGAYGGTTWNGESIIARSTLHTSILTALTSGKSTLLDGSAVTLKKG